MITFYMIYPGGQYVEREIEALSKEAPMLNLPMKSARIIICSAKQNMTPRLGMAMTNAVSIHFLDAMIGMSENSFFPQIICSTNKNDVDKLAVLCYTIIVPRGTK